MSKDSQPRTISISSPSAFRPVQSRRDTNPSPISPISSGFPGDTSTLTEDVTTSSPTIFTSPQASRTFLPERVLVQDVVNPVYRYASFSTQPPRLLIATELSSVSYPAIVIPQSVQGVSVPTLQHRSSLQQTGVSFSPNLLPDSVQSVIDSPMPRLELASISSPNYTPSPSQIPTDNSEQGNTFSSTQSIVNRSPIESKNLNSQVDTEPEGKTSSDQEGLQTLNSFSSIFRNLVNVGMTIYSMDPSRMKDLRDQAFMIINTETTGLNNNSFIDYIKYLRDVQTYCICNLHREAILLCDAIIVGSRLIIERQGDLNIELISRVYINLIASYLKWIIFSTQDGLQISDKKSTIFGVEALSILKQLHNVLHVAMNQQTTPHRGTLSAISVLNCTIHDAVSWNPGILETIREIGLIPNVEGSINVKFMLDYNIRSCTTIRNNSYIVTCIGRISNTEIVVGSMDSLLRVWEIQGKQCLQVLAGHSDCVQCVGVISNDGIVSGSNDKTLKIWNVRDGTCIQTLRGHANSVLCITCISPTLIVSGSEDKTLRVWEISSAGYRCLEILSGHTHGVSCVGFAPSGLIFSSSRDRTLRVWKISSGQHSTHVIPTQSIVKCFTIMSNNLFVTSSMDSDLHVWRVGSDMYHQTLKGHTRYVSGITQIAEDAIVTSSWDGTLRIWKVSTGECIQVLKSRYRGISSVACISDNLFVSGFEDGILQLWRF